MKVVALCPELAPTIVARSLGVRGGRGLRGTERVDEASATFRPVNANTSVAYHTSL